ncbi:MAG: hypothetical protein RL515_1218 [Verrucomicrobiota bacterium]
MEYRGRVGTASRHSFIQGRGATASRPWGAEADAYADASLPNKIIPPPEPWGYHPPPETIHPLKGKPETGMIPAGICPQVKFRFPSAAPFERCLSLYSILHTRDSRFWPTGQLFNGSTSLSLWSTEPLSLRASRVLPLVPVSPCPRAPSRMRAPLSHASPLS